MRNRTRCETEHGVDPEQEACQWEKLRHTSDGNGIFLYFLQSEISSYHPWDINFNLNLVWFLNRIGKNNVSTTERSRVQLNRLRLRADASIVVSSNAKNQQWKMGAFRFKNNNKTENSSSDQFIDFLQCQRKTSQKWWTCRRREEALQYSTFRIQKKIKEASTYDPEHEKSREVKSIFLI